MSKGEPMVTAGSGFSLHNTLKGLLPAAPARLLLLGQDVAAKASMADGLSAQGYGVTAAPLFRPQDFAQFPSATRQGVYQIDVPGSLPETECTGFDAVLVLGVSANVQPLALFEGMAHCLGQDGVVVLMGGEPQDGPPRVRRWLEYVVAIAGRCGFTALDANAETSLDLTASAPGSFVRAFRKTSVPRWQLRHLRAGDYAEIAVLFQEVFGHPLSPELWAWKYANGRGNAVLASRGDVLVAHYGGMYREILLCGTPEWAYGGSDVMVHPQERGVMTRQGPFLLTAATTAELYGPVAFGFPTERAMLVAERMGLYTKAGQMAEVRWEPAAPRIRLRTRVRPLTRDNGADHALVDRLWGRMAQDLRHSVVGLRDWKFIDHRYFGHPHHVYDVLAVTSRITGQALGVVVLRRLEGSCELLDVIAPLANLPVVLDQARRMTARWGLPYLYCWITSNQAHHFVACGGKQEPLNIFIPTSCWTDDPRVGMVVDKWWLTSGDTDFR